MEKLQDVEVVITELFFHFTSGEAEGDEKEEIDSD